MSEIEKVKQTITDAEVAAAKAKQATMAKLNAEETWMEKNPGKVTAIVIAMFAVIIVLLAKSCA